MRAFVLDTSAIIRYYVPDGPMPEALEDAIVSAWRTESILLIPELALAEVAQVLWKKERAGFLTKADVDEILSEISALPLEIRGHYDLLPDAVELARKHQITIYDSLFIALAKKQHADLITADQEMAEVLKLPAASCGES